MFSFIERYGFFPIFIGGGLFALAGLALADRPGGTIGLIIFFGVVVYAVIYEKRKIGEKKERLLRNVKLSEKCSIGKYIYGLQYQPDPTTDNVECLITDDALILLNSISDDIGRIPLNAINDIFIDNKSQITQRLTATRMLTLGIFSLATPKKQKHEEYCLVIDWEEQDGIRNNAIFEFSGFQSNAHANYAMNILKKYMPKKIRLKSDEKKCPYCAEIIKQEAKICRYCHQQL